MIAGEVTLQNEPIGRHNPHHALDFTTLNSSATPAVAYATVATIARALFGRYPMNLSVGYPRTKKDTCAPKTRSAIPNWSADDMMEG